MPSKQMIEMQHILSKMDKDRMLETITRLLCWQILDRGLDVDEALDQISRVTRATVDLIRGLAKKVMEAEE